MSEKALFASTTKGKDPDKGDFGNEKISVREGFRRARRNALFWASAAALLPFGVSQNVSSEASVFMRGIRFDDQILVGAALVALVVAAISFARARWQLEFFNNPLEVARRWTKQADQVIDLEGEIRRVSEGLATADAWAKQALAASDRLKPKVEDATNQFTDEAVRERRQGLRAAILSDDVPHSELRNLERVPLGEKPAAMKRLQVAFKAHRAIDIYENERSWACNYVVDTVKELRTLGSSQIINSGSQVEKIVDAMNDLAKSSRELKSFSGKIHRLELGFDKWWDTRIVYAAMALGGFVSAFYLVTPTTFDRAATDWGLKNPIEIEQPSPSPAARSPARTAS